MDKKHPAPEHGMPFDKYAAIPRMNASTLVHGHLKSMLRLRNAMLGKVTEPSSAMIFGNRYHELILEPESFKKRFCVMPNFASMPENVTSKGERSDSWATSFCKESVQSFNSMASLDGKEVIKDEDYQRGMAMLSSINANKVAREIVETCYKEVVLFGEIDDVEFKVRLDLVRKGLIADLKGTRNADPRRFGRDSADLGYAFRLSIYHEIYRQNFGGSPVVKVIAVETAGDFDCAVIVLPDPVREQNFGYVRKVIEKYKKCVLEDRWPGVDEGKDELEWLVPNWAMPEDDGLDWSDIDE